VVLDKIKTMFYVYLLKSQQKNRLYIGRMGNLKRRLREHQSGKVRSTKKLLPIELVFYEAFKHKKDAIRRERYFKTSKGKSSLKQIIRESIK